MDPCNVVIADADTLFRHGLRAVLDADGIAVVADVASAAEAVQAIAQHAPDVALIDHALPDADGLALIRELADARACRTILLTSGRRTVDVTAAARHGANGYLLKSSTSATLIAGVRRVAAQAQYADPAVAEALYTALRDALVQPASADAESDAATRTDRRRTASLTVRECSILRLVASGHTNAQIATTLGVAPDTVKNHLANVRKKLGVRSRTQAVVAAARAGAIDLD